jgi:hypothetical protein
MCRFYSVRVLELDSLAFGVLVLYSCSTGTSDCLPVSWGFTVLCILVRPMLHYQMGMLDAAVCCCVFISLSSIDSLFECASGTMFF